MEKNLNELWQRMEEIGLSGWLDIKEAEGIVEEVSKLKPGNAYLEIGTAYGKSLAIVSEFAQDVFIWSIDRLNWKQREENLEKLGLSEKGTFLEGDSQAIGDGWIIPIDLLFIDGDHTYEGVTKDIFTWTPKVRHGGRIMFHDYNNVEQGVVKAIDKYIKDNPLFTYLDNDHGSLFRCTKV